MPRLAPCIVLLSTQLVAASAVSASPLTLDFVPQPSIPEQLVVDIVLSGLPPGGPPSLGGFELVVGFDPATLLPLTVDFGPFLGDPASLEALIDFDVLPGALNLAEASLLSPAGLDLLQPASFLLATLTFERLGGRAPPLVVINSVFSDTFGDVIKPEMPEPGAALLFVAAGLGLWGRRRFRRA